MNNRKRLFENIIHGIFLVLGLITVGFVLLISVYLIISGIPAIGKIGIIDFNTFSCSNLKGIALISIASK